MGKDRLWTIDYVSLMLAQTLNAFGMQMINSILPLYLLKNGSPESQIGFIMGSFTFSAFFIRPLTPLGIRRVGKKNYMLIGVGISFLAALGYIWARSAADILFVRVFHGLGLGISTTMMATFVADIVPDSRRGEGIGLFGLSNTFATSIAPLIALGIIVNYDFYWVFLASAAILGISLFWLRFLMKPNPPQVHQLVEEINGSFLSNFKEPRTFLPAVLNILVGICFGSSMSFLVLYGQKLGVGNIGYYFLVSTICVFLSRLFSGKIFDKKGPFWVLIPGAAFLFCGFNILSIASSMTTILIAAMFYGTGMGLLAPSLQAWMMNRVAPEKRSVGSAVYYNSYDVGIAGGSFLLGIIAEKAGYSTMFRCTSLSMIVFLIIYLFSVVREKNRRLTSSERINL